MSPEVRYFIVTTARVMNSSLKKRLRYYKKVLQQTDSELATWTAKDATS